MITLGRQIRMYSPRTTLALMLLLTAALAFGQQGFSSPATAKPSGQSALCKSESLPLDVQSRLKREFGSWKIQGLADLSTRAHERWQSEKPLACPGIAVGKFDDATRPSYAVLLVSGDQAYAAGYKLLVFNPKAGQQSYEMTTADSGDSGAANYFIHATTVSKFFDQASRKQFKADSRNGILLVDSAENEYEVEVYFWSGGQYRQESIDY